MRSPANIKLGIACVYFFRDEDAWILDLQLKYIEETTRGTDYTIYAAGNRLQPELRAKLKAKPFVKFVELPDYSGDGGPEHGHYLGLLLNIAKADGCTHLCTLDCDSFPVMEGWAPHLAGLLSDELKVTAVFRAENQDSDLPHPCGTFMLAKILDTIEFDFYPSTDLQTTPDFRAYIAETRQRVDTGTGLGFALWRAKEPWLKLYRSNKTDVHFMMAGVYADVFFHLGASSRAPAFHHDYQTKSTLKLSQRFEKVPFLWRLAAWAENRYLAENQKLITQIRQQLRDNSETFIQRLQG